MQFNTHLNKFNTDDLNWVVAIDKKILRKRRLNEGGKKPVTQTVTNLDPNLPLDAMWQELGWSDWK